MGDINLFAQELTQPRLHLDRLEHGLDVPLRIRQIPGGLALLQRPVHAVFKLLRHLRNHRGAQLLDPEDDVRPGHHVTHTRGDVLAVLDGDRLVVRFAVRIDGAEITGGDEPAELFQSARHRPPSDDGRLLQASFLIGVCNREQFKGHRSSYRASFTAAVQLTSVVVV